MGYFDKFNKGEGIPFMDGRTKVDIPVGKGLHLKDYGFIKGDDAPFAVMLFEEYPENFMFGNSIVTDDIKTIEKDMGSKEQALNLLAGVSMKFTKRTSKRGREYMSVEFIEDNPSRSTSCPFRGAPLRPSFSGGQCCEETDFIWHYCCFMWGCGG